MRCSFHPHSAGWLFDFMCCLGCYSYRSARLHLIAPQTGRKWIFTLAITTRAPVEAFGYSGHAGTGDYLGLVAAHGRYRWFPREQQQGRRQRELKIPRNVLKKIGPFLWVAICFPAFALKGNYYQKCNETFKVGWKLPADRILHFPCLIKQQFHTLAPHEISQLELFISFCVAAQHVAVWRRRV
jgi:hypothetical protein